MKPKRHHVGRDPILLRSSVSHLVVLLAVEDAQDGEEEVDDVEVKADGSRNLLLDLVVSHDHLGVDQNVSTEDESTDDSVSQLKSAGVGEEGGHEAEDDHDPQSEEEVWLPAREIVLGLAREEGEGDEDSKCEDEGLEHDLAFVEGRDDADAVGLESCESTEEEQIGWVRLALPEGQEHEADCAEERDPEHPLV